MKPMVLASAFVQQSCLEKALMRPRIDWFWPRTGAVATYEATDGFRARRARHLLPLDVELLGRGHRRER